MKMRFSFLLFLFLFISCQKNGKLEFYQAKEPYFLSGGIISNIFLHLKKISVHEIGEGVGAVKEYYPDTTFDLLSLSSEGEIFWSVNLKPGMYTMVSLVLGGTNDSCGYLVQDDSLFRIKVPSGIETGIKLHATINIAEDKITKLKLIWNPRNSIQKGDGFYLLNPSYRLEIE
jgi:hypothetical protein|uniref:DUF4382 domain-containing protein n=1 Tax=candidate division WOR-3 bacterium TaxID=2052148 RepID=A0A7C3YTK1_UNCW3